MELEEAWLLEVKRLSRLPAFPRNVGTPHQSRVEGEEEYLEFLRRNRMGTCYTAKYSWAQLERGLVDMLFFDFDLPELSDHTIAAVRELVLEEFRSPLVFFSGRKGFHVLVLIPETPWMLLDVKGWASTLKYEAAKWMDVGTTIRLNGLMRAVYTWNVEGGKFKVPVDMEASPAAIRGEIARASNPREVWMPPLRQDGEFARRLQRVEEKVELSGWLEAPGEPPACIKSKLDELKRTGELDHEARLLLVWYFHAAGVPAEQVISLFERYARDYNERITRYQVEYAYRKGYSPYSCRSIASMGM